MPEKLALKPDEKRLIRLAKKGDPGAQKGLYDLLAPKMFAVCIRYMGDRMAAEDVLQDGFVTLFAKLDSFSGIGSFEGWARKIFVNTALMSLRKKDALRAASAGKLRPAEVPVLLPPSMTSPPSFFQIFGPWPIS